MNIDQLAAKSNREINQRANCKHVFAKMRVCVYGLVKMIEKCSKCGEQRDIKKENEK